MLLSFGALGDRDAQPRSNKIKLPNITDAIFFKDMKAIKEYIKLRGNLDTPRDSLKRSPLIMAAAEGHLEIVKLLVKSGASVNQLVEESRYTPTALIGALSGSHVDVAQYLISAKADVNLAHGENTTLRSALNANKDKMLSLVRLLVRAKVDVNKTTKRFIPIFSAVRTMNPKIVELILSRKPNLKVVNACQQTLLLSALVAAKDAGDQADAMLKIIRALLKGGGQTPIRQTTAVKPLSAG